MAIDQQVMDQLIAASIGPAMDYVVSVYSPKAPDAGTFAKHVSWHACQIAEAVYAQREKCINERAEVEAVEKSKRQEKVRTSKVITMKPEDMSGGMP